MAAHGVTSLPVGNTGAQMAGWLLKEIKTVADLKGLKFHVAGLASMVLSKLGAVLQPLAAVDIYPALRELMAAGALLRAFPKPVMQASFKAVEELYQELSDKSPAF